MSLKTPDPMTPHALFAAIPGWPDVRLLADGRLLEEVLDFHVNANRATVWELMADTSRLNEAAGYPPIRFVEEEGLLIGTIGEGKSEEVFEEHPWEYENGHWLSHYRFYRKGFLRHNLTALLLTEEEGGCRVVAYIGCIVPEEKNERLVRLFIRRAASGYRRFLEHALRADGPRGPSTEHEPADGLEPFLKNAGQIEAPISVREAMVDAIRRAAPDILARINPRQMAAAARVPERAAISFFLHGVRSGLFQMNWDVICPHCRGARETMAHLASVPAAAKCDVCRVDFGVGNRHTLEVSFAPHPSYIKMERPVYCSREAANQPHVLLQRKLAAGQSDLRLHGVFSPGSLEVFARERGQLEFTARPELDSTVVKLPPQKPGTIVKITVPQWQKDLTLPEHLLLHPEFAVLFPGEAPGRDISVELGRQAFLFTDLVGSTSLFEIAGDTLAFQSIREHFRVIYNVVDEHGGSVVKTMGDGAMAFFADPLSASAAAFALQGHFREQQKMRIRIGLHLGEALAIRLAAGLDFFGRAVNLAAKFMAAAGSNEIVLLKDNAAAFGVSSSGDVRRFEHPAFPAGLEVIHLR